MVENNCNASAKGVGGLRGDGMVGVRTTGRGEYIDRTTTFGLIVTLNVGYGCQGRGEFFSNQTLTLNLIVNLLGSTFKRQKLTRARTSIQAGPTTPKCGPHFQPIRQGGGCGWGPGGGHSSQGHIRADTGAKKLTVLTYASKCVKFTGL